MDNPTSAARRENWRIALLLALTAALLVVILFITHPIAKNLMIGLMGLPLMWTLHLTKGFGQDAHRAQGMLGAAAVAVLVFAALLVTFAPVPLQVMFAILIASELPGLWRWFWGRGAAAGE